MTDVDTEHDGEIDREYLREWLSCNPDWWDPDDPGKCCLCGEPAEPAVYDSIEVSTPDGYTFLNLNDPSCLECRVDVAAKIERRGVDQKGLDQYAE